ncbi:MAG: AmmeMemoRadiSam system protein A [Sandaracinaceae bacterium]
MRARLEAQEDILLAAARDAIAASVERRPPRPAPEERDAFLQENAAVFVTLRSADGALRGCIGELEARRPLIESVRGNAQAAATRDPRFAPVQTAELGELAIGISVLTAPTPIPPAQVEVGRHGLLVERPPHRGVLLPEVALAQGWDAATFLTMTCRKARLPDDAWQDAATTVSAFETHKIGAP